MNEKNAKREKAKQNRVHFDMNLGERVHKDDRFPSRQDRKENLRRYLEEYEEEMER